MRNLVLTFVAVSLSVFCGTAAGQGEQDLDASASATAQKIMIIDGHIDVPYRLDNEWSDATGKTDDGDFDYVRARQGGLDIPFMAVYTPPQSEVDGTSFDLANRLIDRVEALAGRAPEKMIVVRSPGQAEQAWSRGLMGLAIGMENGSPLEGDLGNVAFFQDRGISYIGLVHGRSNHLADSSYDEHRQWNGLSPFGKEVVAEMNRLGVMIDVSHLTDDAFWQVLELSKVPVIASHSSARAFTPGWERNMSDEMIKALAARGGVIQINFGSSFLTREAQQWYETMRAAREAYLEANELDKQGEEARSFSTNWREEHPFPYATLGDIVAHYQHVIELVGIDHVGIGSDFDGVGDSLPEGMKDVSDYPNLVREFLKLGYSPEDIAAILGGNLMRVWEAAAAYAEQTAAAAPAARP